jgi:hypothetical protein
VHTICIDFGTSSLRAALRQDEHLESDPLVIAPRAQIDNASIPSAIYIPMDGKTVLFGDKALEAGLLSQPCKLFARSPKAWLRPDELSRLDEPAAPGVSFSRRTLLCALLTLTVHIVREAVKRLDLDTEQLVYRISHPVWLESHKDASRAAYQALFDTACNPATPRVDLQQTAIALERWQTQAKPTEAVRTRDWHVDEPVAAAMDLIPDPASDERRATLLVDVGAGTIDLGLFISVVPFDRSPRRRKLIPMCEPRSLLGAGDVIDTALVELMVSRLGSSNPDIPRFENDIRRNKERLFNEGTVSLGRTTVKREELERAVPLVTMAKRLKAELGHMFEEGAQKHSVELGHGPHQILNMDLVFAGGGGNLTFLRQTVGKIVKLGTSPLKTVSVDCPELENWPVEASRARMAVAIGGTAPYPEWPETERTPSRLRG